MRNRYLWCIRYEQVDVIVFAVKFDQLSFEIKAYAAKNLFQFGQYRFSENTATIFCDKDQVDMEVENAVPAMSYFICFAHRPKYN